MLMLCFVRKPSLTGTQDSKVWNFSNMPRRLQICSEKHLYSYRDNLHKKSLSNSAQESKVDVLRTKMSLLKFTYVPPSRLAKEQSRDFIHRYCVRFILLWLRLPTDSWRLPRTQAWRHQDIWICHFFRLHVDSPDSCGHSVQCVWINSC